MEKHIARIHLKMQNDKKFTGIDLKKKANVMAAYYTSMSGIKPDFVYLLRDAFSIDESLLKLPNNENED